MLHGIRGREGVVDRIALWVVLALAWLPCQASAEGATDRAATLAESANNLGRAGEYAAALDLFEQAYAVDPQPVLLYNIGRVAEKLKDYKKAAGALRAFLEVEKDPARRAKAEKALTDVLALLPAYVTVSCAVTGAVIEVDGEPVGRTPLQAPIEVSPGEHAIRVVAPPVQGRNVFRPFGTTISLKGQESLSVVATLEEEPAVLALALEPTTARVVLDGKPVELSEQRSVAVASGDHRLRVEGDGYEPHERTVTVTAGETKAVKVALSKKKVETAVAKPVAPVVPALTPGERASNDLTGSSTAVGKIAEPRSDSTLTWVLIGTGVAALVGGGIAAAVLLSKGGGGPPQEDRVWSVALPLEVQP